MSSEPQRGVLLVVSSPSGAGKTTLCSKLRGAHPNITFSVSYTTRPPRPGERDGVDYHFVSGEEFERMVQEGAFAEWAWVHGHRYGTALRPVAQALAQGLDMLFDIDYQGARQLKCRFPEAVMVFILPPSVRELVARLERRATEAPEVRARRLKGAVSELDHYDAYDFLVINDDLEQAYRELEAVYLAARCMSRNRAMFAERLVAEAREELP